MRTFLSMSLFNIAPTVFEIALVPPRPPAAEGRGGRGGGGGMDDGGRPAG